MNTPELSALMEERALGYRFLARAFRAAPDAAFVGAVLSAADANAEGPLAPFYAEAAEADGETLRIDLAADYNQLFLGMSAHPVAPYESVYTSEEGLLMQKARDEALRVYRLWGLRVPESFDLPEDHIALELELMACLADRTRAAAEAGEDPTGLIAAQRAFLSEHLGWAAALCDDVEKRARTAFYYGIAGLTREHLAADEAVLGSL
ncbi:molecular chaperone TorD family protein [Adlercreutzia muris]|uniref:TorD/DmsD family molecular chaperone n=1 Tax=Adlercreutzia muris TaxID=1796610 RepID=UPI0021D5D6BF|nr:molecular chaperone TorD family protein [Adlercreutzia muris]MCU7585781.1 molecular chaperone TorD family protein [Adlercreutzia muris]